MQIKNKEELDANVCFIFRTKLNLKKSAYIYPFKNIHIFGPPIYLTGIFFILPKKISMCPFYKIFKNRFLYN